MMDVVCGLPLIPHSFDLPIGLSMIDGLDDDDVIDTTAMPLQAPSGAYHRGRHYHHHAHDYLLILR